MRQWNLLFFVALAVLLPGRIGVAQQAVDPKAEVAKRVASYVDAFNRRDVTACAKHWSENGEYVVAGAANPVVGREAIGKALEKLLSTDEEFRLAVDDQRFRKVSDNVIMEEGTARLVSESHGTQYARYLVVHVKKDGTWFRDSIRETLVASEPNAVVDPQQLELLVGNWEYKSDEATLSIEATWKHDKRFIERRFELQGNDGQVVTATEFLGWDPAAATFRSWSFDSQGGFEQAVWNRDGDQWLIKADAVLPSGIAATEQRSLSIDSDGNLRTQSLEQLFGGRLMPGSDPVTLVRQASPKVTSN